MQFAIYYIILCSSFFLKLTFWDVKQLNGTYGIFVLIMSVGWWTSEVVILVWIIVSKTDSNQNHMAKVWAFEGVNE